MIAGAAVFSRTPLVLCALTLLVVGTATSPDEALAQSASVAAAGDSTRALAGSTVRTPDLLARRITIDLQDVSLEAALRVVAEHCQIRLSYSSDVVPVSRRITISRSDASASDVLEELLRGTNVDYVVRSGYVVLVRRPSMSAGTISSAQSVAGDPAWDRDPVRPQLMDRVIVMGTPVSGAPERELASGVTVITSNQIASLEPATMADLFRMAVPGVVAWDLGISGPLAQVGSVRGSSSFTSNYLKTYVDGVELASPYMLFAIDPYSIERMEIIRGPQGSALYGSDAISGVVQIVTRRGTPAANWRPQMDGMFTGGVMQSRYVNNPSATERQSVDLSTGGGTTSLGVGGTYASAGAIAPGGSSGTVGTFGGFHHSSGPLHIEGTARYTDLRFTAPDNPLLRGVELPVSLRPPSGEQHIDNETYGVTFDLQPSPAWRQSLVVGIDRNAGAIPPQREPTTVADALLGATSERASKTSLRYSSMVRIFDGTSADANLTLGAEWSAFARERLGLQSDVAGAGQGLEALYHDDVRNTGIFGQLKVDVRQSLFLTGGLRAERNSAFGDEYGTALAPMIGAAYTRDLGPATAKFRVAFGKGIRPPPPSARQEILTVSYRQVANPDLEPESQSGVEAGVELYRGDVLSLQLTGYAQHADGLIQEVPVNLSSSRAIQYQNVGRIFNQGIEAEGTARAGLVRLTMSFAVTDSRVRALSRAYSGDLGVGDRVPEVPVASGTASMGWDIRGAQLSLGTTYLGSWIGYDWAAYVANQEGPVDSTALSLRNYLRRYPSVVKPFFAVSHSLGGGVEWFARIDNLTNVQRNERDNLQLTAGRTWTAGLRLDWK